MREHQPRLAIAGARRWLLALVLGAALLPLVTTPASAEPTLEILEAGWDGMAAPATWTPVRLRVTGGDTDMRVVAEVIAEIEIQTGQTSTARYPIGAYGQEIAIPAGESRDVTIWFPADGEPRARARVTEGGRTLAETEITFQVARPGWPLVGVVAEAEGIDRTLRSIELPYQGLPLPLAVAGLGPDALTTDAARLGALDALVVQGAVTAELTDAQRAAIDEWVRAGGHLVIAGGPGATQAARILPDGALPATITTATTSGATDALAAWLPDASEVPSSAPLAAFEPAGGVILAGSEENPLAWRTEMGSGTVTILAVDPALEPFASWPDNASLLRAALSAALPDTTGGEIDPGAWAMPNPSVNLQFMTGTLPQGAHLGWPVVATVLAGFALLAGPLLYLVLRRLDRRELSWLIVPAGAVVLSLGIYAWGVQSSGRDLIANVATYIDVDADGGPARHSIAAAFYGPTRAQLSIPLSGEASVRASVGQSDPYGMWGGAPPARSEPPFRILDGSERRVDFLEGQYDSRSILIEQEIAEPPRVSAEIGVEEGLLVGTVRNDSGLMLEDAAVAIGTTLVPLGDLAPGQSVPVRLEPTAAVDPMMGAQSLGYLLFGEEMADAFVAPPGAPTYRQLPNDPDIQRRANILDQMVGHSVSSQWGVPSVPLTFVAYTEDLTAPEWLVPENHPQYSLTLLRQALNLALPIGSFVMPEGLIPAEITEVNSPYGLNWGGSDRGSWMELRNGTATYTLRAPLPANATAEFAVLRTEQVGPVEDVEAGGFPGGMPAPPVAGPGTDPAEADVFSVYDWESNEWISLPAGGEHRLDGARVIGPDGEMRVRIQASESELVRFVAPALTIEGSVSEAAAGERSGS